MRGALGRLWGRWALGGLLGALPLLGLLLGGCGEPEQCQRLRARICEVCGDQSPACQQLQGKSGSASQCDQTLHKLDDLLKRLQTLPEAEATDKTRSMCAQ